MATLTLNKEQSSEPPVSSVEFIPASTQIYVKCAGETGFMSMRMVKDNVDASRQVLVATVWMGNVVWKPAISVTTTVKDTHQVKSFRIGKEKFILPPSVKLLVTNKYFGLTETGDDSSEWMPAENLKDGVSLRLARASTGGRLFDLENLSVSKCKQEKPQDALITTYSVKLASAHASVITADNLVFG
jgi:hypothetical protein